MPIWEPIINEIIQGVLGQSFGPTQDAIFVIFRDVLGALGGAGFGILF